MKNTLKFLRINLSLSRSLGVNVPLVVNLQIMRFSSHLWVDSFGFTELSKIEVF